MADARPVPADQVFVLLRPTGGLAVYGSRVARESPTAKLCLTCAVVPAKTRMLELASVEEANRTDLICIRSGNLVWGLHARLARPGSKVSQHRH